LIGWGNLSFSIQSTNLSIKLTVTGELIMKWLLLISLFGLQILSTACSFQQQAQSVAQRRPLEKRQREFKLPTDYDLRDRGYDPKTGRSNTYDYKPRIEQVDEKSGKIAFKWIGYDGKEKTVIYQRADAVDVIVSATVSKTAEGLYLYTYKVENLPSSGSHLSRFIVQNFAADSKPIQIEGKTPNCRDLILLDSFRNTPCDTTKMNLEDFFFIGQMSNMIEQFKEGNWIVISPLSPTEQYEPGRSLEVKIVSKAAPGVVKCQAVGGERTMKGVGEHMPSVLENLLPGYEDFPKGYTVGPVDNISSLSNAERIKYLLDKLPQFNKSGWITDDIMQRYDKQLKAGNLDSILKRIESDLKSEAITTEVYAVVQAMK
jgi:hypothetical protein